MSKSNKTQKKNRPQKYAPIGLWFSGVALLATVIFLVIKFLSIAGIFTLANDKWLNLSLWISAGLIVVSLGVFTLLDPQRVRQILTGRQARYGSNAAIMLVAFFGIMLVINIIVYKYPGKPMDFTEDKQNSLAAETLDTLSALPEAVHAIGFFTSNYSSESAKELLENYRINSDGKFTYEFIDPDQNPVAAQSAGVSGDGKIYLQMDDRHEIVSYASEEGITSALIRLMNPGDRTVYFLAGHGERDIDSSGEESYSEIRAALEAKNYTVQTINLLVDNSIPNGAQVVIIAGSIDPLTSGEITTLKEFSSQGGALVILSEPAPVTNINSANNPMGSYLTTEWGIVLNDDIVIDTNSATQPLFAVAAAYGDHAITEKLDGRIAFFPISHSISFSSPGYVTTTELVATIADAWGETNFEMMEEEGNVQFDSGEDVPGPIILALAAENSSTSSRIVVFGDADFASDAYFDQYANGDLLINSIDWAAGEDDMINLTSPGTTSRSLNIPSSFTIALLWISFLCIFPGLIVAGGVASWLIRKSRG